MVDNEDAYLKALLVSGQIIGLLSGVNHKALQQAAVSQELLPEYRAMVAAILEAYRKIFPDRK